MNFVPSFHLVKPSEKMKAAWWHDAVQNVVFNANNQHLLAGKDVKEIEEYSSGNYDMKPYIRMFKSMRKKIPVPNALNGEQITNNLNIDGMQFECLPLIPVKIESAAATAQKVPIEIKCRAQDALAMKKKKEDLDFLKNKPRLERALQDIADNLGVGPVDLGATKHSAQKLTEAPMGMDLEQSDEYELVAKLIYALRVETAFQKALQQFHEIKKANQIKGMEIMDQLKFGVSVHQGFTSATTGLPDLKYLFPGDVEVPISRLPDYGDNTHRIINLQMTPHELFNEFGDEICDEAHLDRVINGKEGYCSCNGASTINAKDFGSKKLTVKYIEIRTVDWVGVVEKAKSKRGIKYFTEDEQKCTKKIWGQNTYGAYWLYKTDYFFGIHKLGYAHRTKGQEARQNFSTNIYKSKKKSAVELSIGENKQATIANLKLLYALIMSAPAGKYIDLRFLRGAIEGLKDPNNEYTMQDLVNMIFEKNLFLGDTTGWDGKYDGQIKPFIDIPGGLKTEVQGYIMTIVNADQNISNFTGINEQLTGQSANPEGLVGLQKLLINSSINAIHYITEAIRNQYESLYNNWASLLQGAIEAGGKTKEAMINFIGIEDVELLDGLNDTPLHNLTIKVETGQREIERQNYINALQGLKDKGIINSLDEFLLTGINDPQERFAYLAVREKKFIRAQDKIRQEGYANQQALMQQQGQNMVQGKQAEGEENIKEVYAKGDVQSKLLNLSEQLGMTRAQFEALSKRRLQDGRGQDQLQKSLKTIFAKKEADRQEALV